MRTPHYLWCALITTGALTTVPAAALAKLPIGAQDDQAVLAGGPMLTTAIGRAHQVGATRFRVIVRGTQGLDAYEPGISAICAARFNVQITLTDYAAESFVRAALERWAPCVNAWSFWNEPELNIGLGHHYRYLQRAGYSLTRDLDPHARVLVGETSSHATLHQIRVLTRLPADGLAIHPYHCWSQCPWPSEIWNLPRVRHASRLPIYITEFGFTASQPSGWHRALTLARRARVRELVAYQVITGPTGSWDTSLFDHNGAARPGVLALRKDAQ